MAIVGILSLVVCILGLAIFLALSGFSRGSFTRVAEICFAFGLLAFLVASGAQSCSTGTTGAAVHSK